MAYTTALLADCAIKDMHTVIVCILEWPVVTFSMSQNTA